MVHGGTAFLAACLALAAAGGAKAQGFAPVVDPAAPEPRILESDGLTVTFRPAAESQGEETGALVIETRVEAEGFAPVVFPVTSYPPGTVPLHAVVRLHAEDPVPSLLIQSYTGGAHCCTEYLAVTPVGDALKVIGVGMFDGDLMEDTASDLDGDGRADFRLRDDRLLYEFAPYAASWAPPLILNLVEGEVTDVSARPGFRALMDDFAAQALAACKDHGEEQRNGACAAYVAVRARQGAFEAALQEVAPHVNRADTGFMPAGCAVETVGLCPEGQEIRFSRFEDALRHHLQRTGYLPR